MTRADHHHEQCPARQTVDDDRTCSWLINPNLPREERYLLGPDEVREARERLAMGYEDPLQDRQTLERTGDRYPLRRPQTRHERRHTSPKR